MILEIRKYFFNFAEMEYEKINFCISDIPKNRVLNLYFINLTAKFYDN